MDSDCDCHGNVARCRRNRPAREELRRKEREAAAKAREKRSQDLNNYYKTLYKPLPEEDLSGDVPELDLSFYDFDGDGIIDVPVNEDDE